MASLLDAGDGAPFDPSLAADVLQDVERRIAPFASSLERPVRLAKERLNERDRCEGLFAADVLGERPPFEHRPASAAGALAHKSIELDVGAPAELGADELVDAALVRLARDHAFSPYWDALDPAARGEIRMRALRDVEQFRSTFPPVRPFRRALAPVTELWFQTNLARGAVQLRGKVDLVLNAPRRGRATRVLIDLKGGRPYEEHAEDMRFYALLFTLRCGVPPYRVATFHLASGEWQPEDVDRVTLGRAADRVVAAVDAAAHVARRAPLREPALAPGPHCSRCPRRASCPVAA